MNGSGALRVRRHPGGHVDVKAVPIKYYAVAIIFILFDLETIFLFIWALAAQPLTGLLVVHLRASSCSCWC
jgi:NADH:ubiquinone oxidoreductase subunit 3 (subunit A)